MFLAVCTCQPQVLCSSSAVLLKLSAVLSLLEAVLRLPPTDRSELADVLGLHSEDRPKFREGLCLSSEDRSLRVEVLSTQSGDVRELFAVDRDLGRDRPKSSAVLGVQSENLCPQFTVLP